jgi:hypothetical protein
VTPAGNATGALERLSTSGHQDRRDPHQCHCTSDQTVCEVYARYRTEIKSWVEPTLSSHFWRAVLPTLKCGTYAARIDCMDENGRPSQTSPTLEVVA